jgi:hypothetical protein
VSAALAVAIAMLGGTSVASAFDYDFVSIDTSPDGP